MPVPITIWLVEDGPLYRRSFKRLVASTAEFALDRAFERYEDVPDAPDTLPDLVVMDLQLPGCGGIEATRDLGARWPSVPVVVLTMRDEAEVVFDALRAGASGYVVKGARPAEIFRSLREARVGGTYFAPNVARHVLRFFAPPGPEDPLTGREVEVLRALAEGCTKSGIADRLYLSPHTIDSHLRSIYAKLHVHNAAEATAKGVRTGII